jgi:hypothetical protein
MSVQVLSWVLTHSMADGAARLVLISLANHASSDGADSYPSVETMRREARLRSRRTVQNALRKLADAGAIEIQEEPGPRGQGRYRVLMDGAHDMRSAPDDAEGALLATKGGASRDSRVEGTVQEPSKEPSPPVDALFAEWQRLFDKPKTHLSPARRKALKRALDEEPDVALLLEALRGFRAHRDKRPGGIELGDIFGTYPGSGDLRSRIEWMRSLVDGSSAEMLDPGTRDRLVEEIRYTLSLPHRPNRERAEEAWRRLRAAGFKLTRLNEKPWLKVTR